MEKNKDLHQQLRQLRTDLIKWASDYEDDAMSPKYRENATYFRGKSEAYKNAKNKVENLLKWNGIEY